jgi:putative PIN family toxin of toxin-antitoxin system
MPAMERVVLDTSVVVAGLRSRFGASNALLRLAASRMIVPSATTSLFLEYEAVLKRPEQRAATGLTLAQVDQVSFDLASVTQPVETHYTWRPQLDDANDEMVLEVAVNGGARWIATHNIRDMAVAARRFGVEAIRPGDLVKRILQ